ncbi:MAG: DUF554 domain-containing protein [Oscillospiraceae bacterium]|nr:DUF554 domain-containing protein [Oscillospiraceae bacterium]
MTGTIVNVVAIVAGSLLGLLLKCGMPQRIEETLMKIMGVSVLVIGLNGVVSSMFTVDADGGLSSSGELLMLCSLVIGAVFGELLNIDDHLNHFGSYIESKTKADGFSRGFISASIIYCVGAMAIIGSLNDGLTGDSSVLFIKSALDGVNSIIFGASLGIGVAFSSIPVLVYQGGISLLAGVIAPLVSDVLLNNICAVGYVIVACIGMNISGICKIRVANLLPALIVPVLYQVVLSFIH